MRELLLLYAFTRLYLYFVILKTLSFIYPELYYFLINVKRRSAKFSKNFWWVEYVAKT